MTTHDELMKAVERLKSLYENVSYAKSWEKSDLVYDNLLADHKICEMAKELEFKTLITAATRQAWQPIATAPRDGSRVLVYRPSFDGDYIPRVGVDYYATTHYTEGKTWMRSREDCQPTHWMPLPEPPTGEK